MHLPLFTFLDGCFFLMNLVASCGRSSSSPSPAASAMGSTPPESRRKLEVTERINTKIFTGMDNHSHSTQFKLFSVTCFNMNPFGETLSRFS